MQPQDNKNIMETPLNDFTTHPLAPTYFKYIEILKAQNELEEAARLENLVKEPLTDENRILVAKVLVDLVKLTREEEPITFD